MNAENTEMKKLVVISDVHLGSAGSKATELNQYLRSIQTEYLILNGDIIDCWNFRPGYFPLSHFETISIILDFIRRGTKVYYLAGNHDDVLRKFSRVDIDNFVLADEVSLEIDDKKFLFFHGDKFDFSVSDNQRKVAVFASRTYEILLLLNNAIDKLAQKFLKKRVSLTGIVKRATKKLVCSAHDFEKQALEYAIEGGYDYVVCGHIHLPQHRMFKNEHGSVTYLNSGDWLENIH